MSNDDPLQPWPLKMDAFQTADLERLQVGVARRISKTMALSRAEVIIRDIGEDLSISFRHFVWAEDIGTLSVRHPANWWEAVKERFLKRWLEVKYTVTMVDVKATYPGFRPSVPDEKMVIKVIKK